MSRTYIEAGPPYLVMDEETGTPIVNEYQTLFGVANYAHVLSLDDDSDDSVHESRSGEPTCVPNSCVSNTPPPDITGTFTTEYKYVLHDGNLTGVAEDETDRVPIIVFTPTADRHLFFYSTRLRPSESSSSNITPRPCLWTYQACGLWRLQCTEGDDYGIMSIVVTNATDAGVAETLTMTYVETGPPNVLTEAGGVVVESPFQFPEVGNAVLNRME